MTAATLAFHDGTAHLHCAEAGIRDEARPLESPPPFAAWSDAYAVAQHHPVEEIRLIELGRAIGAWLEGSQRWLTRLVERAPAPLILEVKAPRAPSAIERAALGAPWELIARPRTGHLALDDRIQLSPVRRLDVPNQPRPLSPFRLSVMFMAAQPLDVAALDFEREEAAIASEIDKLDPALLDLFVEESGSLDGMVAAVNRAAECTTGDPDSPLAGPVDILHISCHGAGGGVPALLFENESGGRVPTTAPDLAGALGAHVPRLALVLARSTAEAAATGPALASELCLRGWPAVLGWSTPVDDGASWLAARLYHQLAQRRPLVEALARCRCDAAASGDSPRRVWHQARLFLGRSGGGPIAGGIARRRAARVALPPYLDRGDRMPVARNDEFVGRRRALQRVLAALRGGTLVGAVVHGAPQLGKSSLAARVSHRRADLETVVVRQHHDARTILAAIAARVNATAPVVARHRPPGSQDWDAASLGSALRELLEGPCCTAGSGAILLVLDDFEQVLDPPRAPDILARVCADLFPTMRAVIAAFVDARTESRLLFTSRYRFAVPDAGNTDLTRHLWHEPLGAMLPEDLAKRVRAGATRGQAAAERAAALALCRGNPGLLQILLTVIDCAPARWPGVEAELRGYAARGTPVTHPELAAFLARMALDRAIGELVPHELELLRLLTAFETRVPTSVAASLGSAVGIAEPERVAAIDRMVNLGLLDLTLAGASRPGGGAAARATAHEVEVNGLVVLVIAAAQPVPDDTMAQVARAVLRSLRTAWSEAVSTRALRECRELTRLAELAEDTSTLAEVAGPVACAVAETDVRRASALATAVVASESLWPDADELRWMAEACERAGAPEVAGRLLQRGLGLERLDPAARAGLQSTLATWHYRRGDLLVAQARLEEARDAFGKLGDVKAAAVTQGKIANVLVARGRQKEALGVLEDNVLPVYERFGDARAGALTRRKIADIQRAIDRRKRWIVLVVGGAIFLTILLIERRGGDRDRFGDVLQTQRRRFIACVQQFNAHRGFCLGDSEIGGAHDDRSRAPASDPCSLTGKRAEHGYTVKDVNEDQIVTYSPNGSAGDHVECRCVLAEDVRDGCIRHVQ